MFQGHGYGLEVDIWAMGCILYQLIGMCKYRASFDVSLIYAII